MTYVWATDRVKDVDQWEMMLSSPLPGQRKARPTPESAEVEGAEFMAAMALLGS